jgi:hypothetical protein
METKNRPDMIILVMAYLGLLSLGALSGGLMVFMVIIPAMRNLGAVSGGAVQLIRLPGVLALLMAVFAAWAMIGLWQGKAAGRAGALILTTMVVLAAALSIPILLFVGLQGVALWTPLLTAVFLLITGSGVLWGLTRPSAQ